MENKQMLQARSVGPIKLKDKKGRGGMRFNLKETFGFVPEEVIIQKIEGHTNTFLFSAVLTPDELKKEQAGKPKPMGEGIKDGKND